MSRKRHELRALDPAALRDTTYCSFCGRAEGEYEFLIRGPGVQICDHCVSACSQEIDLQRREKE